MMKSEIIYDKLNNEFLHATGQELGIANLMWHITGECNLFCDHCFSHKSKHEFNISKLNLYIEIFRELGVKKIDLSGGEPLLYRYLHDLCFALKEYDIPCTITSSGFVRPKMTDWLLNNPDLFTRIILSVNAPNACLHEGINHVKGSFNKVRDLAYKLAQRKNILRINTVCTEKICNNKSVKEFVDFINEISPVEWCVIQEYSVNNLGTKDLFDNFLCAISRQSLSPKVKLITRNSNLYCSYYVLDEDGFLYLRGKENKRMHLESPDIKKFLEENYQ